jgi:glycerate 2-kinase
VYDKRMSTEPLLRATFAAAVAAADPLHILPPHLSQPVKGSRTLVLAAGKAAASMSAAVARAWGKNVEGLAITRYAHGLPASELGGIRCIEAGHPVPDEAGEAAAREMLEMAAKLGPQDHLLALISGGGSSLMTVPAAGLTMAELKATNKALLACGAPIEDMNCVRKHLSAISGGRLAAATQAQVHCLVISDVTGDDPSVIASGPCSPDVTTYADAIAVLARWNAQVPERVMQHLQRGVRGEIAETPKANDTCFTRVKTQVIATAHQSLVAAAQYLQTQGYRTLVLGDTITGEAREVAKVHAAMVREALRADTVLGIQKPLAIVSGGECTVTLRNAKSDKPSRGGRCTEFLLSLALELEGVKEVSALTCDTDGIDGSEPNAGAWCDASTLAKVRAQGVNPRDALDNNDAWSVFNASNTLIVTGPTRTNVNDLRVILISD